MMQSNFDKSEFERYIREDIDGRLYWEDLMERVTEGRFESAVFKAYDSTSDDIKSESWTSGYDEGFTEGYNEGVEEGSGEGTYDDGYAKGYEEGIEDAKADRNSA